MSVSHKKHVERRRKNYDQCTARVYSFAADYCRSRFNECFAASPPEVQIAYESARKALDAAEAGAIAAGKAYRSSFNMLTWYR